MERMVNDRLVCNLEKENLLAPAQCGFWRLRSAVDHLISLERQIQNCFAQRQQLVTVFFDLEKAYDTTWRFGILCALHGWKLQGHLAFFISNFLQDRRFRVRLGNVLSMSNVQENGVPQGSVSSVTLVVKAINSVVIAIGPLTSISLYVDDVAVSYASKSMDAIELRLQLTINRLLHWALQNGFSFSAAKTQCVLRLWGVHQPPVLYLNNHASPVVPLAKFLGLVLDSRLSWEPHLRQLRATCERSLNVLRVLSGVSWGGDCTAMLRLYRSLVCSKLDYGSCIFGSATQAKLRILDPVHHVGIRLATAAFRTSPVVSLRAESG
jgi:hypothetical protein